MIINKFYFCFFFIYNDKFLLNGVLNGLISYRIVVINVLGWWYYNMWYEVIEVSDSLLLSGVYFNVKIYIMK